MPPCHHRTVTGGGAWLRIECDRPEAEPGPSKAPKIAARACRRRGAARSVDCAGGAAMAWAWSGAREGGGPPAAAGRPGGPGSRRPGGASGVDAAGARLAAGRGAGGRGALEALLDRQPDVRDLRRPAGGGGPERRSAPRHSTARHSAVSTLRLAHQPNISFTQPPRDQAALPTPQQRRPPQTYLPSPPSRSGRRGGPGGTGRPAGRVRAGEGDFCQNRIFCRNRLASRSATSEPGPGGGGGVSSAPTACPLSPRIAGGRGAGGA